MNKKLALLAGCCVLSCTALASDNLVQDALKHGQASGFAPEDQAQKIMAQTHSQSPITVNVRVLTRYAQPGCARLDYIVEQPNVKAKDGSFQVLKLQWQMNICEDGQPPVPPLSVMP